MSGVDIRLPSATALTARERLRVRAAFGGEVSCRASELRDLVAAADRALAALEAHVGEVARLEAELAEARGRRRGALVAAFVFGIGIGLGLAAALGLA